jgi:hypothetical protein
MESEAESINVRLVNGTTIASQNTFLKDVSGFHRDDTSGGVGRADGPNRRRECFASGIAGIMISAASGCSVRRPRSNSVSSLVRSEGPTSFIGLNIDF